MGLQKRETEAEKGFLESRARPALKALQLILVHFTTLQAVTASNEDR
jgi:hypothetical protein